MTLPNVLPSDLAQACKIPAYVTAFSQLVDRVPLRDVTNDLAEAGLDRTVALRVTIHAQRLLDEAISSPAHLVMIGGCSLMAVGIGLAAIKLYAAMEEGEFVRISYGVVVTGAAMFARGLYQKRNPDARAVRERIEAAVDEARGRSKSDEAESHSTPPWTFDY